MGPFAILSAALAFPDADLLAERHRIAAAADALPPGDARDHLARFLAWWCAQDADDLQTRFSATFDFSRRTSLDLTYIYYGDRRQRGLALLKLRQRYAAAGMEMDGPELPDHLPVILEFTDARPSDGGAILAEFRPAIELLRAALGEKGNPWAAALDALCALLPPLTADERDELLRIAKEGPPTEDVGLEPFAPPEVMPDSTYRRMPAACTSAEGSLT